MDSGKVGVFISALRKELSMTQQDLANRLNVTNKAVSKWETGEGYPEITILPALADALGVSVDELLRGAKSKPANPGNDGLARGGSDIAARRLDQAWLKFRNMRLLSASLAVTGLVAFYVVTLTSRYELIGFGVLAAFLICSFLLFITQYNTMKAAEQKENPGGGSMSEPIGRSLIVQTYFWAVPLLAALPYLVFDNGMYERSILALSDYIRIYPAFLAVGCAILFFAWRIVMDRLGIGDALPKLLAFENAELREGKAEMNLFALLYGTAYVSLAYRLNGIGIIIVLLIYIACSAVYFTRRKKIQGTGILLVTTLRNLLCLFIFAYIMPSIIRHSEVGIMMFRINSILVPITIASVFFCFFTAIIWMIEYRQSKAKLG